MKTKIVLIKVYGNDNARKNAEDIEQGYYLDMASLADEIEGEFEVKSLSDFMDSVNNQEFLPDEYYISYVNIQE